MSGTFVRDATTADHDAIAAIYAVVSPYHLLSAASLAHTEAATPEERRATFVAEVDGRVVAAGWSLLNSWSPTPGAAAMSLTVVPEFRKRGIGTALYQRIQEHAVEIGGGELKVGAVDEEGIAYAERRGFVRGRINRISRCDLTRIPAPMPLPDGVRAISLSEVDDMRAVYETDALAIGDIPADAPMVPPTYEVWLGLLRDPLMDKASSMVLVDGDAVVALAYLQHVDARVNSAFTATHPAHRGRGYGMLVKSHSLHAAATQGALSAYTANDATNAPMLAVNARLGYEAYADQVTLTRAGVEGG